MDKPAEGLAFARIERDDGIMPYPVLIVGDVVVKSYMNGYEDYAEMEKINAAHASIVKPLREKAETLEAEKELRAFQRDQAESSCSLAMKDRDAWKDAADNLSFQLKEIRELADHYLGESRAKNEDAERLVEILKKVRSNNHVRNEEFREMQEALAAHEALKGKT